MPDSANETAPRDAPNPGSNADEALAELVRKTVGAELRLITGAIAVSRLVFGDMWGRRDSLGDRLAPLVGASLATDALLAAQRSLLACDFLGMYADLRRSFEMQMVAYATLHRPDLGEAWLAGHDVRQKTLRGVVAVHEPGGAAVLDRLYHILSQPAHGKVQSLAAYGNRWNRFQWPVDPLLTPPDGVRRAFLAFAGMARNLTSVEVAISDQWARVENSALRDYAQKSSGILTYYFQHHVEGGANGTMPWSTLETSTAREWLTLPPIPPAAGDVSH